MCVLVLISLFYPSMLFYFIEYRKSTVLFEVFAFVCYPILICEICVQVCGSFLVSTTTKYKIHFIRLFMLCGCTSSSGSSGMDEVKTEALNL